MKQKNQLIVLAVLVVMAVVVWSGAWNGRTAVEDPLTIVKKYAPLAVENPGVHWDEMYRAQATEYKSTGRNPFSIVALPPSPTNAAATTGKGKQSETVSVWQGARLPPPPAPPPPAVWPANLKYFGYGTMPAGSPRRAFISDGDNNAIVIATEGDVLLGHYRILKIGNADLEFQDTATGQRGKTILEEPSASPPA